ncbi:Sec63 Brl domain-containing protein [Mycena sanguinolenta]|nr:Sec63 Brl domain-containing protein [Mycena sanguinolenta]
MSYQYRDEYYQNADEQEYFEDHQHGGPTAYLNDPYYQDEIANSSPSPPERGASGSFQMPRYEMEDIQEYEDDVPYYEDDPIHNQQYPAFDTPPSFHAAASSHVQPQRHRAQYQPQFGQQRHGNTFRAPAPVVPPPERGSNPRNSSGIRLRPVSELPDMYRGIFKFGVFNAVQSSCLDTVSKSDENMVISAPTGSGKTCLFELTIIRMLGRAKESGESVKCVYMAPTKALCSERQRDWSSKFEPLGIKCCELTGDTVQFGRGAWGDAKNATIIITTGEKWDSLTRNWGDHGQILSQIQLFLVDEVHILNESRGSTLEVVISRMKTRGSAVRFVLVSATVPNIHDIAAWIGNKRRDDAATVFQFGEDFRPCKLTRHVIGVPRARTENDFSFTRKLDYKVFAALQAHSIGKPILVFVSTRKGVITTADQLLKDYTEAEKMRKPLPWSHPRRIEQTFHEKHLGELAAFGIGVHHAGLTIDDRRAVEDLYLKGLLRVVVATSTLAVGVNLPAHTVVIKGVQIFQNNVSTEYSDLDVMQMLGRAGRPQFDKDGIAIILCETDLEQKYRELVQGKTIVESSLHKNLSEHLNSEIGLGTITNIRSAKEWLRSSFLFQRIQKNPAHYSLGKGENQTWEERVDDMVTQSVERLRDNKLIAEAQAGDKGGALTLTEFGDIMSKFYIRQSTMGLILALPDRPTLRDILEMISGSEELSETKLRTSEKTVYNKLRKHNDIRFEVKKVEKTSDKVFLLIQAVLGGISLNSPEYKSSDSQPNLEAFSVFKHIPRIARVVVEVAIVKKRGAQLKYGLELVRCLTAKAWEDRPVVLRQIESIGEKSLKVLAENGITTLALLGNQQPYRIETLLNRRPPFGHEVLASVAEFPQYTLAVQKLGVQSNGGRDPVELELSISCGLVAVEPPNASKAKKQPKSRTQMTAILTLTSDSEMIDFRRIPTKALKDSKTFEITAELTKPSQSIVVYITSESLAGVTVTQTYKPDVAYKEYPTRDTRPPTALDLDLEGLEDDPDFWNMNVDEHGDELPEPQVVKDPVVRDLTKGRVKKDATKPAQDVPKTSKVSPSKPEKLANGNYECNHPCKDKKKCRHMCCRDGLAEPPKPKKRAEASPKKPTAASGSSKAHWTSIASPQKSTKTKNVDSTMENLERLHERTNVSLKLPEGGRLKLDSTSQLKRKQRPPINFSVELTQLGDGQPATSYAIPDLKDDDDDLPEPHELLNSGTKKREPSPETNYSDSEIDSLIRLAPLDLIENLTNPAPPPRRPSKQIASKIVPKTPPPSRKRYADSEEAHPPPKRSRFEVGTSRDFYSSPAGVSERAKETQPVRMDPLFTKFSDESDHRIAPDDFPICSPGDETYDECEDFILDCDRFPTTPALTTASDDSKDTSDISITHPALFLNSTLASSQPAPALDGKKIVHFEMDVEERNVDFEEEDDDMKEFDAWLNSGAVEIVR